MSLRDHFLELRKCAPVILPSLLQCDFGNLEREVQQLQAAGICGLHLDVMDGHFVPNLTYGMPIVAGLRGVTDMPLDVHLMIEAPEKYVDQFIAAGSAAVTIHAEATSDAPALLDRIRASNVAAGIAINPDTAVSDIEACVGHADLVLIMSVQAGFGGQTFRQEALAKLRSARKMFGDDVILEIDGGINRETIGPSSDAGAELLVVGSAIFKADEYSAAIEKLNSLAAAGST